MTPVVFATVEYECPLWVMSRHRVISASRPFSPQSGHSSTRFARPLSAKSGRQRRSGSKPTARTLILTRVSQR